MAARYINIHTHRPNPGNEIFVRNILLSELPEEKSYQEFPYSMGMHPWYLENTEAVKAGIDLMESEILNRQFVAIGECGLDKMTETPLPLQTDAFKAQIRLAEKYRKPMIIHCVKAYNEILKLRKTMHAQSVWVFHGFNSSLQVAEQIIDSGCMLSFGHLLLQQGSKAAEVLPLLDHDDFFLETDDHDISILDVYSRAAELRQISIDELSRQQEQNFASFLDH